MSVRFSLKVLLPALLVLSLFLGTVAPAAAAGAAAGTPTWHTVVKGETLFSIGRRYNVSPWAIAAANKLANPNHICVGQRLYVPAGPAYPGPQPCGSYYTVQRGDTLLHIGRVYGVSAWSIAAANKIYNMNYIRAGQRLFIPCR
jgi:LysM repeat protein